MHPVSTIRGSLTEAVVKGRDGKPEVWQGAPLALVKRWMEPFRGPMVEGAPKFTGGCIGFWGYDVVRSVERLPEKASADLPAPDYAFVRVEELWIIDQKQHTLYCAVYTAVPDGRKADRQWLARTI
ncbi:hypothetical protein LJK87_40040 [Paenibacillus sp. P25]|nr:hypothetical protein LJK87_40040 [Paenibacillus sp. P25]